MSLIVVLFCLLTVFGLYYANNPLRHGWPFLNRRFVNWLPLGMTYAFLYMGRYNLQVAKNALGPLMARSRSATDSSRGSRSIVCVGSRAGACEGWRLPFTGRKLAVLIYQRPRRGCMSTESPKIALSGR
jgi:hypothetical protein